MLKDQRNIDVTLRAEREECVDKSLHVNDHAQALTNIPIPIRVPYFGAVALGCGSEAGCALERKICVCALFSLTFPSRRWVREANTTVRPGGRMCSPIVLLLPSIQQAGGKSKVVYNAVSYRRLALECLGKCILFPVQCIGQAERLQ